MHPLISWILFLGISGAVYIVFKGIPCWILETKIGSDKIEAGLLGKKVRKRRRVERVQFQEAGNTSGSAFITPIPLETQKHRSVCAEPVVLEPVPAASLVPPVHVVSLPKLSSNNTSDTFVRGVTSKSASENDHTKTKKQKQNAVKREKQKLLKARVEEERLKKLQEHQRMLEEERLKAQMRKAEQSAHTRHPRSSSGEWIVVTPKDRRHVTPVFASVPQHGLVFH